MGPSVVVVKLKLGVTCSVCACTGATQTTASRRNNAGCTRRTPLARAHGILAHWPCRLTLGGHGGGRCRARSRLGGRGVDLARDPVVGLAGGAQAGAVLSGSP